MGPWRCVSSYRGHATPGAATCRVREREKYSTLGRISSFIILQLAFLEQAWESLLIAKDGGKIRK